MPSPPHLEHWRFLGGEWTRSPDAPVDSVAPGPGWLDDVGAIVARGRVAYLGPGDWQVPSIAPDRAGWDLRGQVVRIIGIPGRTTILGDAGPGVDDRRRTRTRRVLRALECPSVTLHGLRLDGGIGVAEWSGWGRTEDPDALASLVELRRCGLVRVSWCTFTRCAGATGTGPRIGLPERWNQGTFFADACAAVAITDCGLEAPLWMEGLVLVNCAQVDVDRFTAVGPPRGWTLSTPLHCFGPDCSEIRVRTCTLGGHRGSALNLGGRGSIEVSDCVVDGADARGRAIGGGIDCGAELASLGWPAPPAIGSVVLLRNRLDRIAGAAITVGGGSPEAFAMVGRAGHRDSLTVAELAAPPSFVPGQRVRRGSSPEDDGVVTMVDLDPGVIGVGPSSLRLRAGDTLVATGLLGTTLAQRVLAAENRITRAEAGLDIRSCRQVKILRNTMQDVLPAGHRGPQGTAIQLIGVDGAIIDGNAIALRTPDPDTRGIFTWDCRNVTIASNTFAGVAIAWLQRSGPAEADEGLRFASNLLAPDVRQAVRLESRTRFADPTIEGKARSGDPFGPGDILRVRRAPQ